MYRFINLVRGVGSDKNYNQERYGNLPIRICHAFFTRHFGTKAQNITLIVSDTPIAGGKRVVVRIKSDGYGHCEMGYHVTNKKNHNCKGQMWWQTEHAISEGLGWTFDTRATQVLYVGVTEGHIA